MVCGPATSRLGGSLDNVRLAHNVSDHDYHDRETQENEMSALAKKEAALITRPLKVLEALIKQKWAAAEEAAERATAPFYIAIGEMLIEAKSQMPHGEFGPWVEK